MFALAVREADMVAMDSLIRKLPAEQTVDFRLLQATQRRDTAAIRALETEARALTNPFQAWPFLVEAAFAGEDYETAERFARLFAAEDRPARVRRAAHNALATFAVLRGQWQPARAGFAEARRLGSPAADYIEASYAARAYVPATAQERLALHDRIMQLDSTRLPPFAGGRSAALREHLRLHLAGSLTAAAGDTARALQYARRIDQLERPAFADEAARGLAESVRAQIAWSRGDAAETLRLLEPLRFRIPLDVLASDINVPFDQMYERYLRAEALLALGRHEEALRWYDGLPEFSGPRAAFLAPADLRRGQIYEQLGQPDKAVTHYARFIRLWEECDPPLRPQVEYARERLTALRGGR